MQRVIIVFDLSVSVLENDSDDEILLYQLMTCLYLCLKVENRVHSLSFENFIEACARLKTY